MSATTGNAFRLAVEPDGLAILTFDCPGEKANKYSTPVMTELEAVLDGLAKRSDVKALLLVSGKPDIFIAGADVNEIAKASDPAAIANGVRRGQEIFGKLANLPFPTVAAIEGACVGGGCETILAMDWRLASDSKKTQIGLPEIKLGILPAWGGTTRLPRVVGLTAALDVILAGKVIDSKRAQRMGLVDQLVPAPILLDAAKKFARGKFGTKKRANAAPDGGPLRVGSREGDGQDPRRGRALRRLQEGPRVGDEGDPRELPGAARGARRGGEGLRPAARGGAEAGGRRDRPTGRHAGDEEPREPLLPDGGGQEGDRRGGGRRRASR